MLCEVCVRYGVIIDVYFKVVSDVIMVYNCRVEIGQDGCNYKFMNCPREVEIHLLESLADRRDPC
jgi:hypothetical protein